MERVRGRPVRVTARGRNGGSPRVVIVLPADPERMRIGGIASFVRTFVRFAPADFELSLIGVSADRPTWRWVDVELEGRPLAFLPALRTSTERRSRIPLALRFGTSLAVHRRPRELDEAVIQFHRPATDIAYRRAGRACVRFVHLTTDDLTQQGSESRWRRLGGLLRRFEKASLASMDRVFVVNAAAAEAYRRRWPSLSDRIDFVPNFYDDTVFRALDGPTVAEVRSAIAGELGIEADRDIVLHAGRLDGQKDPDLVLDAFRELRRRHAAAALLVAGDGALRGRLERRIAELDLRRDVRMLAAQSRSRINELMNVAALLLITSRFETGPTIGYEALSTGLPVVTTDVGEVARIVRASGAGRVTGRGPGEIADAMLDVLGGGPAAFEARARAAAAPFAASAVLEPIYEWHRAAGGAP
jgi:glycosyltransferase involved in cell wall biosynthesis